MELFCVGPRWGEREEEGSKDGRAVGMGRWGVT